MCNNVSKIIYVKVWYYLQQLNCWFSWYFETLNSVGKSGLEAPDLVI